MEKSPPRGGGIRNFTRGGEIFLPGEGNLRRSNFDHSNLFQSCEQLSVNTKHQLKSKLAWPKCTKTMKLKQKWNRSNDCSQKMLFLLGYKFKNCYLVKRGGGELTFAGGIYFSRWGRRNKQIFGWLRGTPPHPFSKGNPDGWVQLFHSYVVTVRRQFTFYRNTPRTPWCWFNWPWKDESLSQSWSQSVVLNPIHLDWESSTLITRSSSLPFFSISPPSLKHACTYPRTQTNTYTHTHTHFSKIVQ